MLEKIYSREWLHPFIFIVFSILLEIINFASLGFGVLPKYFLLDFAFMLIYLGILFLTPTGGKTWISLASVLLFVQVFFNILNNTLYHMLSEVFNFSMLSLGGQAVQIFDASFVNWWYVVLNVLVFFVFVMLSIYLYKTLPRNSFSKKTRIIMILCLFIGFQSVGIGTFCAQSYKLSHNTNSNESTEITDKDLWNNSFMKVEAFKRFGTFGFYIKDIGRQLSSSKTLQDNTKLEIDMHILEGSKIKNTHSKYFGTAQNDNLIMLCLESFDSFAIDPINTPFLYELTTGGATFMNNYHSKNATNISEVLAFVGNSPYERMLYDYGYSVGVEVPYALTNLFKENDVESQVNYYHGYSKYFYRRSDIMPKLGFDNIYGLEDYTITGSTGKWTDWDLDSEIIKNIIDSFIPKDKHFFSYYTSITTHGPYNGNNARLNKNVSYVREHFAEYENYVNTQTDFVVPTNASDKDILIYYKASCKDTDDMVKLIFDRLAELNILDTTTVVMYGDHYSFYENLTYKVKGISTNNPENAKLYNVPLIIYNDKVAKTQIDSFCNSYDIYPTVCDLFGFEYNCNLAQGFGIFTDDIKNSVLVSFQNGMCTDKMFTYDSQKIEVNDESITDEDIATFKKNIATFYKKQETIEKIYTYNYFSYPHPSITM